MAGRTTIVSNNTIVFSWAFMTLWIAMLCLFTWLAVRDGGIPGHGAAFTLSVFAVFWFVGLSVAVHLFKSPRVRIVSCDQGLLVEEIWLWSRRATRLGRRDTARLKLVDTKDSDGDARFKCEIAVDGGRRVTIRESHAREVVVAAYDAIMQAMNEAG